MALAVAPSFGHPGTIYDAHSANWNSVVLAYGEGHTDAGLDMKASAIHGSLNGEGCAPLGTISLTGTSAASIKADRQLRDPSSGSDQGSRTPTPEMPTQAAPPVQPSSKEYLAGGPHTRSRKPFSKWMNSLHKRRMRKDSIVGHGSRMSRQPSKRSASEAPSLMRRAPHCQESSAGSSFGFVAAVRSVSASLASISSVARSRGNTAPSLGPSRTDRSSRAGSRAARMSEDSAVAEKSARLDGAAIERSMQRRRVIGEIISTEEVYISDVRFLNNVYTTLLASMTSETPGLRDSIKRNLTDIVTLHEEILSELHRLVPYSEHTELDGSRPLQSTGQTRGRHRAQRRWRSLDSTQDYRSAVSLLQEGPEMLADPQVAAAVARTFGKRTSRFFIYNEYGAKYKIMLANIGSSSMQGLEWDLFRRGLEVLAATVGSTKHYMDATRKASSLADLLMKPIQKICRYPLLFAELLKCTTVMDCPNSHMEVETTLDRLREATAEINEATDDTKVRETLQRTWLLQDRLVFPQRKLDAVTRNQIRSYGRIHLCGALHVCWQSNDGIKGQYMICLLYQNVLCLASAGRVDPIYTIMACIDLGAAHVASTDNGHGIQCHMAPFSWKLVFVCDCKMYEFLMTAWSPEEEVVWRSRLGPPHGKGQQPSSPAGFSWLGLDMKPLGSVTDDNYELTNESSSEGVTAANPDVPVCHVILKNTGAAKDGATGGHSANLANIQSPATLNVSPQLSVISPPRSGRARLENLLAEVWSHELLPPAVAGKRARNEHLERASSIMRKLSVANLTGSLSRRSGSLGRKSSARPSGTHNCATCEGYNAAETDQDLTVRGPSADRLGASKVASTVRKRPRVDESTFVKISGEMSGTVSDKASSSNLKQLSRCSSTPSGQNYVAALPRKASFDRPESLPMELQQSSEQVMGAAAEKAGAGRPACDGAGSKEPSLWGKMGMMKNEGNSHGFRSLFR